MSYLVDRDRAFLEDELVAILSTRARGARSLVLLRDGELHPTVTRARTLAQWMKTARGIAGRRPRRPSVR